jgi:AMP phosphorylase
MSELALKVKIIQASPTTLVALSTKDLTDAGDLSRKQLVLKPASGTKSNVQFLVASQVVSFEGVPEGFIGVPVQSAQKLSLKDGDEVQVSIELRSPPDSYNLIKRRIQTGQVFTKPDLDMIIQDVINGRLNQLEKGTLILSQYYQDYGMDEIEYLCRAISESGETLDFKGVATDKHSLGGVPGNKVSLLLVPILAAAGLLIPKTSSRAITSASGTADTMEALGCQVAFKADEILEITSKIGGMICWGGALNLAPADDILIKEVEFPLGLNPRSMMMASIMAKKKAFGIEMMVLDVPTGKGCKVTTLEEAEVLSRTFGELGRRLGIRVECGITFGSSPVGHNIGPALEAQEALSALMNPKEASHSLVEKSTALAGILLEMSGKALRGQGQGLAAEILRSGKAYKKMRDIIEAQGGNPNIKPDEIPMGTHTFDYIAPSNGWIVEINNDAITRIARAAGAPTDRGAGIVFIRKKEAVAAGEPIFRVFTNSERKIKDVEAAIAKIPPVTVEGMLLGRI